MNLQDHAFNLSHSPPPNFWGTVSSYAIQVDLKANAMFLQGSAHDHYKGPEIWPSPGHKNPWLWLQRPTWLWAHCKPSSLGALAWDFPSCIWWRKIHFLTLWRQGMWARPLSQVVGNCVKDEQETPSERGSKEAVLTKVEATNLIFSRVFFFPPYPVTYIPKAFPTHPTFG